MMNVHLIGLVIVLGLLALCVFWLGRKSEAVDSVEALTVEHFKKNLRITLKASLMKGNSSLVESAKILSRDEFAASVKEGVEEGMAEEFSGEVCQRARNDEELQRLIAQIADEVYDEFSAR